MLKLIYLKKESILFSLLVLACFLGKAQTNNNMCTTYNAAMGVTMTRSYASAAYGYLNTHIDTVYGNDSAANTQAFEPVGSCGSAGTMNKTLWYQVTAPKCGTPALHISTDDRSFTNFDTRISVYRRNTTSCTGSYTEIACNDNDPYYLNSGSTNSSTVVLTPNNSGTPAANEYIPGEILFIQVSGTGSTSGNFGLIIDYEPYIPVATSITAGSAVIDWSTAMTSPWGNITNTYIQWRVVGSTGGGAYRTVFAPASSTTITGLLPNTNYEFFVAYVCSAGGKWWSKKGYFTTASTCSGTVPSITSISNGVTFCNRPTVTFTANQYGYTSYKIARRKVGTTPITLSGIYYPSTTPVTWASTTSLTFGSTYQYWIYAYCGTAKVDSTPITNFVICSSAKLSNPENITEEATEIEENEIQIEENNSLFGGMEIYPNPANTEASVEYTINSTVDKLYIQLYDAQGKELTNEEINEPNQNGTYTINLEKYSPGIYFVKVKAGEFTQTKKLTVNK